MLRIVRVASVAVGLIAAAACTPTIRIVRTEPPAFQIPADKTVGIQSAPDGTQPTVDKVMGAALDVAQGQLLNKWLAVEPVRVELSRTLQRSFTLVDPAQANYLIRATPTEWRFQLDPADKKLLGAGTGKLWVKVEILDPHDQSKPPLFTETYWGSGGGKNEADALLRASRNVTGALLRDLTPHRISEKVELDDDDPKVKPGIELCKDGQFEAAHAMFSDVAAASPNSAPALYNLAVLKESRGEYDEAEELYIRATQIQQKSIYYSALERLRRARNDMQAFDQAQ